MANHVATGKKAKHGENIVQRTRAAVLNAFDAIENRGKKISDILADEFEKNPIKFMELASKLMPKEITGNINHSHSEIESLTINEINTMLNELKDAARTMRGDDTGVSGLVSEKESESQIH